MPPKFVQIVSDPKLGLCALGEDGSVWRWIPAHYHNGCDWSAKWELLPK